ncbi:putative surface protein with fasciclin (FAS1) repeats [Streptosporangium saharense]|uniref:Putative surface protein with fasciclin (FAS1) repeats n=2 Tax=Streptosporangium saharense TaxID=1706840 RepID=A0A7W7QPD1_9ACTN|nr:putative surface protein with fasciclin (FAS1) repeats [Streptosporangium saharense]
MNIRHIAAALPIVAVAVSMPGSGALANTAAEAAARRPFGPACSAVPSTGKGSFSGMAADPVATAASNNPALSTLVTAVKKAGLVDTLNSADGITVFAPTNQAFAKLGRKTLNKVLANRKTLTGILTYHVVSGRKTPTDLKSGSFTTLQGGKITTTGSGATYRVNNAKVVCGNVPTRNATVYIVDTVLMPPR